MEGNLRFKIDWGSLIVGREFTVFTLFYFVFEGNFQVQAPGGLIFGGAYTWRGLFSEFYGTLFMINISGKATTLDGQIAELTQTHDEFSKDKRSKHACD